VFSARTHYLDLTRYWQPLLHQWTKPRPSGYRQKCHTDRHTTLRQDSRIDSLHLALVIAMPDDTGSSTDAAGPRDAPQIRNIALEKVRNRGMTVRISRR